MSDLDGPLVDPSVVELPSQSHQPRLLYFISFLIIVAIISLASWFYMVNSNKQTTTAPANPASDSQASPSSTSPSQSSGSAANLAETAETTLASELKNLDDELANLTEDLNSTDDDASDL